MSERLAQLEKLHAADPQDADLTYMIAMEHVKAGADGVALDWLAKTVGLDAHYHYAYYQQARLLMAGDRTADAKAALEAGLKLAQADGHAKAVSELSSLLLLLGG
jgi:tetratricopeptide (TPR) repeat protein